MQEREQRGARDMAEGGESTSLATQFLSCQETETARIIQVAGRSVQTVIPQKTNAILGGRGVGKGGGTGEGTHTGHTGEDMLLKQEFQNHLEDPDLDISGSWEGLCKA